MCVVFRGVLVRMHSIPGEFRPQVQQTTRTGRMAFLHPAAEGQRYARYVTDVAHVCISCCAYFFFRAMTAFNVLTSRFFFYIYLFSTMLFTLNSTTDQTFILLPLVSASMLRLCRLTSTDNIRNALLLPVIMFQPCVQSDENWSLSGLIFFFKKRRDKFR